jgi:hypothetical protein
MRRSLQYFERRDILFSETLSPDTARLIEKIRNCSWLGPYYLAGVQFNTNHILRSLCYFEDADNEPMPNMMAPCDWQDVKEYFVNEVKRLTRIL